MHDVVRRDPSRSVVNRVLRAYVETILARYVDERGGRSLPAYAERELRAAIACGDLAHGFCRVHCSCCSLDLLVAFSCKGRGFCPSCGGRRMADLAAHLVDEVLPDVPTRQWVLTMPRALHLHLAADPELLQVVASAVIDAVFASYVRGARAAGLLIAPGSLAHPGAVNFTQRFGSSLALNIHWYVLALDGVYVTEGPGRTPRFHAAPPLTDIDVVRMHHDARQRIESDLRARGLLREPGDEPAPIKGAEDSLLPFLQAASVQAKIAAGENAGRSIPRLVDPSTAVSYHDMLELPRVDLRAERDGDSLHAATQIEAGRRDALEHPLRYMARPPLCHGRLMLREDGKARWNPRKPWRDGTGRGRSCSSRLAKEHCGSSAWPRSSLTRRNIRSPITAVTHLPRPCAITSCPCHPHVVSALHAPLVLTRTSLSYTFGTPLGPSCSNVCSAPES